MSPGWRSTAQCQQHEPELFDPIHISEPVKERTTRVASAARVCAACPCIGECLTAGVSGKESGVWGGVLLHYGQPLTATADRPTGHGSYSGYRRHLNRREVPCVSCRVAYREHRRAERAGAA